MRGDGPEPHPEPELRWDDSGARSLKAEVCQVQSSREETTLLFGTLAPQAAGNTGPRAKLERRIVLAPSLAKQLAAALASALRDYEDKVGSLNATPAGLFEATPSPADVPAAARPLLALVRGLKVGFGFEKSFKLSPGSLLDDRLILGIRTRPADPHALIGVCRQIGMPQHHLAQFEGSLPQGNTVGFGFEGSAGGGSYKVYLEFWEMLRERLRREPTNVDPALLFLGFKWDARNSAKSAVARYTCYPLLSVSGIQRRLAALYDERREGPSLAAAREIVELAAERVSGDSFVYVEAAEEGNPRKSFDINLYKAKLQLGDLEACLSAVSRRYAIPAQRFKQATAAARGRPFGHLSGGTGRDGEDFLTVYYEIEGL